MPSIWRLGQVRNTKFGTSFSKKMSLNAAKCPRYSFYHFRVIKGKPIGEGLNYLPPSLPPRLGLKKTLWHRYLLVNFVKFLRK